jgi:chorismate-pyruvate lyase
MTTTLSESYGEPVSLEVLNYKRDGQTYRRKIILTVDRGRKIVEVGVVRLNLEYVSGEVCDAIVARQTPLGEIFGQHQLMTHVEVKGFVLFPSATPIVECFSSLEGDAFGRIGLIYCDGKPVVELLEVVAG